MFAIQNYLAQFNSENIDANYGAENTDTNYDVEMRKWIRDENAMRKKKIKFITDVCDASDF